jgi:hypothetical protein
MASKSVKTINRGYKDRYKTKKAKGHGIYACQPPGRPSGIHLGQKGKQSVDCHCGRCSSR